MSEREGGTVQSVKRAMQLLSLFAPHRTPLAPPRAQWTVTDLARATGLHKSVVTRMMATMAQEGFVVQDPVSKAYSVGPLAFAVGNAYRPHLVLSQAARPVMEELTATCGHASYLGVPAGHHYVFVVAVESTRSIRVTIEIGERRLYHSGAIGKVLLAALPDDRIRQIVGPDPLPKVTPYTLDRMDQLLEEVNEVRRSGIAYNREEAIVGVGSVAVGVHDARDECVAALGIVYPTHIVTDAEIEALVPLVRAAGAEISQRLGAGVSAERVRPPST